MSDQEREFKTTAPFGLWESQISKDALFRSSWSMSSPRVCRRSGRAFFCESRPDGMTHLMEVKDGGECKDVLPSGYSACSRVYEYGGGSYAILKDARLIFSNFKDYSVNVLDVDGGNVKCLLQKDTLRYADYDAHPGDQPWVLAIQEDHEIDIPEKVKNYVVAINTDTAEVRRIVEGADFYMFPSFSVDGNKICWVEWMFPDMPWSGVKLFWADFVDGTLQNVELVAGQDRKSTTEPRWGKDGYLYYGQEQTNFRQLYRSRPGDATSTLLKLQGLEKVEIGRALMGVGCHSYAILSGNWLVAAYIDNGASKLVKVDLKCFDVTELALPFVDVGYWDGIDRLSDTSFLVIGSGATTTQVLCRVDITAQGMKHTVLRNSTDQELSPSLFSLPQHIEVPSKKGLERVIHGFFWPPHNAKFEGPKGDKPPLIVAPHGGPTAHTTPGLRLDLQYWNSRGYATFAINYCGSSGHGKEYRDLLNGTWGVLDTDDVAECVDYLSEKGLVDGSKVGIRGGSAGGYNVLQALCTYPDLFAGGVCLYGISEVKLLLDSTHKMESRYVDMLMFTDDMTDEDKAKVMRDRSPVYHAGNIKAPLLILHGEDDKVVPISQAYTMYNDIKERGGDVELVTYPGEGHGFQNGKNQLNAHEEEEKWWQKTLVKS